MTENKKLLPCPFCDEFKSYLRLNGMVFCETCNVLVPNDVYKNRPREKKYQEIINSIIAKTEPSPEFPQIERQDIINWLKLNPCAFDNVELMILEQLATGDTTVDEFRSWVLEIKNKEGNRSNSTPLETGRKTDIF